MAQAAKPLSRGGALSFFGWRVVLALAGADNDPAELGCDRELVSAGDGWTLQSISS